MATSFCFNPFEEEGKLCSVCKNYSRDTSTLCNVEKEADLLSIEKTNRYILVSGVKDMIPVDIERYDLTETVQEWIDRVKEIVA